MITDSDKELSAKKRNWGDHEPRLPPEGRPRHDFRIVKAMCFFFFFYSFHSFYGINNYVPWLNLCFFTHVFKKYNWQVKITGFIRAVCNNYFISYMWADCIDLSSKKKKSCLMLLTGFLWTASSTTKSHRTPLSPRKKTLTNEPKINFWRIMYTLKINPFLLPLV